MKIIFEQVIARGNFNLTSLIEKIDGYHIEGKLTDAERDELYALARAKAAPQYNVQDEIQRLWAAVRALQEGQTAPTEPDAEEWPEFVKPGGAYNAYRIGAKITFNGEHYVCTSDFCAYSPADYPSGWKKQ